VFTFLGGHRLIWWPLADGGEAVGKEKSTSGPRAGGHGVRASCDAAEYLPETREVGDNKTWAKA